MSKNDLTIIIPCYNEEEALPKILPELVQFIVENNYHLILTNDGSKDNTKSILSELKGNQLITVLTHKLNKGYGAAIKTGLSNSGTKYSITIDADGQHDLNDVVKLHQKIIETDADMIVGSRQGLEEASKIRGLGKYIIRSVAKGMMPINIHDINSGMKIYDTKLAQIFLELYPDGMSFSDVIALFFINQRYLVIEEPINIKARQGGVSTIGVRTAMETLMEIINIVMLFNPLKIFTPIGIFFILVGSLWALPILLQGFGLSIGALGLLTTGMIILSFGLLAEQLSKLRKETIAKKNAEYFEYLHSTTK